MKFHELKSLFDYFDNIEHNKVNENLKNIVAAGLIGTSVIFPLNITANQYKKPSKPSKIMNKDSNIEKLIDILIPALIKVESNGNDKAIGDNGKAKGALQLWKVYIDDVNNFYKTNYTHNDAFNRNKAIDIVKKYLTYWGKRYENVTGKPVTLKVLAQIHNGGPNGYKNPKTEKYWEKVKSALNL